jgi:hypothetical protein
VKETRKRIAVQMSSYVDQIREGREMTKQPYPFFVYEDGSVGRQDYWKGRVAGIVGFTRDSNAFQIDLPWTDVVRDPQGAVGTYVVTTDDKGVWTTWETAVETMSVIEPTGAMEA